MATAATFINGPQQISSRQESNLAKYASRLLPLLVEKNTLDVVVNADGALWVNRLGGGFEKEHGRFPASTSTLLLNGIATVRRRPLDEENPILETVFPLTGDRIEGLIPPVVTAPVFAIRTRPKQIYTLDDLATSGVLSDKQDPLNQKRHHDTFNEEAMAATSHLDVIRLAGKYRRNILIVGQTGSGKTTAGSSIINDWLSQTPDDRVVIIEDTPELQCSLPNHVQLLATGSVPLSKLLVASLRLIPKRIIVGEVRESRPARVLLNAWNTGHSGGLATIHANSAIAGLRKLEVLVGGHGAATRERISEAINVVIFIDGENTLAAGRKVREILLLKAFDPRTQDYSFEPL